MATMNIFREKGNHLTKGPNFSSMVGGEVIRTFDLMLPKHVRYQTALLESCYGMGSILGDGYIQHSWGCQLVWNLFLLSFSFHFLILLESSTNTIVKSDSGC